MEWYVYALIALAVVVVFCSLFTVAIAKTVDGFIFGRRQDKNPDFKYFTPEDFNLTVEHMRVHYRGAQLAANIYSVKPVESCEKVVIFQHGFGAGSSSYMTEVAYFAKQGYAVAAVDAYGCNNSAGKKIIGFYAGAEAVIAAYIGVKSDKRLSGKPVIAVGHSWGAYSVLAACGSIKFDGVVAMSAFNAPAQCLCDQLKNTASASRFFAPLFHGWFYLFNLFKFGGKGNTKAANAVKKSGVKALIIHGEKDKTVKFKHSAANKVKGENVTTLILPEKKHNPYNTVAAEGKLAELTGAHKFGSEKEAREYFAAFDWAAATEEDEAVMTAICKFIEGV